MTDKILLLGCGEIATGLAQRLAPQGYEFTGLRRRPMANLPYLHYQQGDIHQTDILRNLLQTAYDIILITMTPSARTDEAYRQAYVKTCQRLIDALNEQGVRPRLILFMSSTAVYAQDRGEWVDEDSPTTPLSFSGQRLLEAEQQLLTSGYASCILRSSGIYGPGRYRLIEQVVQGRASLSPTYTNRIHIEDCVGALAHLIQMSRQTPLAPCYILSDTQPTPMADVVRWISHQLGREYQATQAMPNERGNKQVSSRRLQQTGFRFNYPDFRAGYTTLVKAYLADQQA